MRIFIFLFLLTMTASECFAQSYIYHPFVEDGKIWHMEYNNEEAPEFPAYDFSYFIQGDTIIEGIECKKMYSFNENNSNKTKYLMALFETNQKVFFIPDNTKTSYILYDFSIVCGDVALVNDAIHPEWEKKMVNQEEKFVSYKDDYRRCIRMSQESDTLANDEIHSGWWIEGIGSELGPLNTWLFGADGNWSFLKDCSLNGKELIGMNDFEGILSGIYPVPYKEDKGDEGYVNLLGIKMKRCVGIGIKNGKKVLFR